MKILFLNQAFYPDVVSTAQHCADLAERLAVDGHQVTAIASERGYDDPTRLFPREETWNGVRIRRIAAGRFGKKNPLGRILNFAVFLLNLCWLLIRMPRFDVVIGLTTPPLIGFLAALFIRAKGGRLLYWVMDLNPDQAIAAGWLKENSAAARLLGWMLKYTLRHSSRTVVLDRFMAERILRKGAAESSITIVPPWSHDAAIRFDQPARDDFRRQHGLTGKFVVMYSGNHSPCHPLQTVLEAAQRLAGHQEIVFCFVGGGSEHARVKTFAADNRLLNVVCLPYQPIEKVAGSLGAADLHVVVMGDPYVGIVHPCKIYNVLSLGIPVLYVGPAEGHIPELVPAAAISEWFYPAEHGQVELVVRHVLSSSARSFMRYEEERQVGSDFSADILIGRLAATVRSLSTSTISDQNCTKNAATMEAQVAGQVGHRTADRGHSDVANPEMQTAVSTVPDVNHRVEIPWRIICVGALLFVCYGPVLARMAKAWGTDPNMNHGFFVPFLIGYMVWQERAALGRLVPSGSLWGLPLIVLGGVLLCMGSPSLDTFAFATRMAFVFSLVGIILFLWGFSTIRVLVYPLLLMFLMIPLPGFIIEHITFPLQLLASESAEKILDTMGYSVLREGNILRVPAATLSIVEACSGLRSLLSLTFLGQAYVCLFDTRAWMRPVMALLVVPIAVFANAMRIVVNAIVVSDHPDWLHGIFHESTGWVAFVVAFVCIVLFHLSFSKLERIFRRPALPC